MSYALDTRSAARARRWLCVLAAGAALVAPAQSVFSQATPPPGTFNVAKKAVISGYAIEDREVERLVDGDPTSGWLTPTATPNTSTTATVLWTAPTDIPLTRVDLKQVANTARFDRVTITVTNTAGAVVFGPTPYTSGWNLPDATLQVSMADANGVPVQGSTIRLYLDQANPGAGRSGIGFRELYVWTPRPGLLDPLGGPVWYTTNPFPAAHAEHGPRRDPMVRDDEAVLLSNTPSNRLSTLRQSSLASNSHRWDMQETVDPLSSSTVVAAASGRVLGTPAEQVVTVTRRTAGANIFDLQVLDLSNDQRRVLGTYSFTSANPNSDVDVVVGEFDDVSHPELSNPNVVQGRRCSDVAVCYEVVGPDAMRRMHIDLLSWANLSRDDVQRGMVRDPLILASVTLNTTENGMNVGKLLHQDGTPNRLRLRYGRFPVEGYLVVAHGSAGDGSGAALQVAMLSAYTMRTNPGAGPRSSRIWFSPSDTADILLDPNNLGLQDTWEIATGRFEQTDYYGSPVQGDGLAIFTVVPGTGGQAGQRNVRVIAATWDFSHFTAGNPQDGLMAGYTENLGAGYGINASILPGSKIRAITLPNVQVTDPSVFSPLSARMVAVMFHTTRGPVIQTYIISNTAGASPRRPNTITWPFSSSDFHARPSFVAPTSAEFTAGTVPRNRGTLGVAPESTFQLADVRLLIKDIGPRSTLLHAQYPTTADLPMVTSPQPTLNLLTSDGGVTSYDNAFMLMADLDGDSAWHVHTGGGATMRLGMGRRLGFTDVTTPTVILEEPPRHADYIRVPSNPLLGAVVNVSRFSGLYAQFTNQASTAISFTRQVDTSTSHSEKDGVSAEASLSIEIPAIKPSFSATTTVSYSAAVQNLAASTGSESVGDSTTFTDTDTHSTQAGDQLVFRNRSFDMWNYPVMGFQTTDPDYPLDPYLRLCIPADDELTVVSGGTDAGGYAYQPEHIVGNILSYPYYSAGQGQPAAVARFAPRTNGFLRNGQPSPNLFPNTSFTQYSVGTTGATHSVDFDNVNNSSDSYTSKSATTETSEVSVKAEVKASGGFFDGVVGVEGRLALGASYATEAMQSFSEMSTRSIRSSVQNRFLLNVAPVTDPSRSYNFLPMMWFDKSGAMRLSHLVNLPSAGSTFWGTNYSTPDYALNLPRHIQGFDSSVHLSTDADRAIMKGYEVRDDSYGFPYNPENVTARNAVLSAAENGGTGQDGQLLTLRARVYNLARHETQPVGASVLVRFELQEVEKAQGAPVEIGPRTLIGETTVGPIPGQENRWAQVVWDTRYAGGCSPAAPARTYRIYVVVDPRNAITNETHELFDRDNNPLRDPNTNLVLDRYDGQNLEKGQNNLGWFPFNIAPPAKGNGTAPIPTQQPDDASRDPGGAVTFTAEFSSASPLTHQWQKDGINLNDGPTGDGSVVVGAHTGSVTITNVQPVTAGVYACLGSNVCGSTLTVPGARLTVNAPFCPGDFNRDRVVNSQDFFGFLTAFFAFDAASDFNHDGILNSQDFFGFLTAFFACS